MKLRLLLALLLACPSAAVLADDGAIEGVGGAIQLMDEHPSVVMQKMDVTINLYEARALVDCIFLFHNTGEAADVRMGFPESGRGVDVDPRNPHGFISFATWVDGKEAPTTIEGPEAQAGTSWRRWRTKTVHFDTGQIRTVRVKYQPGIGHTSGGERYFTYEVHTGASWNGPIGLARIRLNLNHDPRRGRFTFSDRFQPRATNCFEWIERDFEPTAADNIHVTYYPIHYTVSLGGQFLSWLPQDRGHLRHGHSWCPLGWLDTWVGAEVAAEGSSARVVRGRNVLDLAAGDPYIAHNGRRSRLPAAPIIENNEILVPVAAVLRALGAKVTYDAQTLTLDITLPIIPALRTGLPERDARAAFRVLASALPGWAPSATSRRLVDLAESDSSEACPPPWITFGDFNGDGRSDLALILWKADQVGVLLMEGMPAADFPFSCRWLSKPGPISRARPATPPPAELRTRLPGLIRYWEPGGNAPKRGRLTLEHDAIEMITESASRLYYWDANSRRYESIQSDG